MLHQTSSANSSEIHAVQEVETSSLQSGKTDFKKWIVVAVLAVLAGLCTLLPKSSKKGKYQVRKAK